MTTATEYPAGPRQRDTLNTLWRLFSSPYLTLALMVVVALALCLAAVLPQEPEMARSDDVVRSQWLALVHHRYPTTSEALLAVGALNVFHSLWFRLSVALLAFNLCLGLINLAETAWQSRSVPSVRRPESFFTEEQSAISLTTSLPWDDVLEGVRRALAAAFARPREEHAQGVAYFHADGRLWSLWGELVLYIGALLMLAGWLAGGWFGWETEAVHLGVGQQTAVRGTRYALRLDDLAVANGDFRAEVVLLEEGSETRRGTVTDEWPLRGGGLTVRGTGYGPAVVVRAKDETGQPLMLQSFIERAEPGEIMHLSFEVPGEERYFAVPERSLVVRVELGPGEETDAGQSFRVRAYRSNSVEPVFDSTLAASGQVEILGDYYTMEIGHYALMQVRHAPGDVIVVLGLLLACGGMTLMMWNPRAQVWVLVAGEGGGVTIKARGEVGERDQRFARVVAELTRNLAAQNMAGDRRG
jgi:cytochrome c biogenesis protein ResB